MARVTRRRYDAEWLTDGHAKIGKRVVRSFARSVHKPARLVHGTIAKWLPAGAAADEPALFRCVHDDGDEEDLEEDEAEEAIAAFDARAYASLRWDPIPPMRWDPHPQPPLTWHA